MRRVGLDLLRQVSDSADFLFELLVRYQRSGAYHVFDKRGERLQVRLLNVSVYRLGEVRYDRR